MRGESDATPPRLRDSEDPSSLLLAAAQAPLDRWMATRLARFPVVVALYEKVKARHQALDQLDVLVKLRDLLRDNREVGRASWLLPTSWPPE